ncbi:hypothetical protein [Cryobacterium sp. PH31-O1]|uniref:hypothetical protein n=1 Tax=Cryobacterium sp. PH31-O1 TaxID=3046306 RepID=UPI0024BAD389|nr:hypothetical protein [Cryobacterium sp. PH31-O1]MDJ0337456.1 hypothetical protein [Cryobacterium sp. PH31-O1]
MKVERVVERIRGITLTSDEAEQIIAIVRSRVREDGPELPASRPTAGPMGGNYLTGNISISLGQPAGINGRHPFGSGGPGAHDITISPSEQANIDVMRANHIELAVKRGHLRRN